MQLFVAKLFANIQIQGHVYHRLGSFMPLSVNEFQLYRYNLSEMMKNDKLAIISFTDEKPWLVAWLQKMLHHHDQYIQGFNTT